MTASAEVTNIDIKDMPLSELMTSSGSVLDEMLRIVLEQAEQIENSTCAFNSAL